MSNSPLRCLVDIYIPYIYTLPLENQLPRWFFFYSIKDFSDLIQTFLLTDEPIFFIKQKYLLSTLWFFTCLLRRYHIHFLCFYNATCFSDFSFSIFSSNKCSNSNSLLYLYTIPELRHTKCPCNPAYFLPVT